MPNIVIKESLDTQGTCYSLRPVKMDSDVKGRAGQVLARSRRAMVQGLQRWTTILGSCQAKQSPGIW